MHSITCAQLKDWLAQEKDFTLVDVREPYEFAVGNLGGINLPMGYVMQRLETFKCSKPVVIYCKSGKRSEAVVEALKLHENLKNLYFLEGGLQSYVESFQLNIAVE
ncbi:MAG: rhodanese-like domain-containing protein [Luteibaculaceae bacterium]